MKSPTRTRIWQDGPADGLWGWVTLEAIQMTPQGRGVRWPSNIAYCTACYMVRVHTTWTDHVVHIHAAWRVRKTARLRPLVRYKDDQPQPNSHTLSELALIRVGLTNSQSHTLLRPYRVDLCYPPPAGGPLPGPCCRVPLSTASNILFYISRFLS